MAQVARRTGFDDETTRRYLAGRSVPASFVAAVARSYGVSADWLLLGRGPVRPAPQPGWRMCPFPPDR